MSPGSLNVNCNKIKSKIYIMKLKNLVIFSMLFAFAATSFAQNDQGAASEQCLINISLFNESAKNKQYADALGPWDAAYQECPGANKVIYSRGREIVQWELSQQKDDASYQKVFDKLMGMYDNRIKYFGDDSRYPTPWILGLKALDYIGFDKTDVLKKPAYEWLAQSIDGLGNNSEIEVLRQFVVLSGKIFEAEPAHGKQYIEDYLKVNEILESIAIDSTHKYASYAKQLENGLDIVFAQSGAADCGTLDNLYKAEVIAKSSDLAFLKKVVSFYKRVKCTESNVYFNASELSHKIQPSSESANGLAEMSYKAGNNEDAINFYNEAIRLSENNADKADYSYKVAQLYYAKLSNYPKAKEYARKTIEFAPNNGNAYLLIGLTYASAKGIYDDPVLAKTVFWAAVDKFVKAKQVDPTIAEDANKLINTYSQYFPSKDDIFFKPELKEGGSFYVAGWIGENTTCR